MLQEGNKIQVEQISQEDDSFSSSATATTSTSSSSSSKHHRSSSMFLSSKTEDERRSFLQSTSFELPPVYDNLDFDLPYRWYKRAWAFILWLVGMLDIFAFLEPSLRQYYNNGSCNGYGASKNTTDFIEFGEGVTNLLLDFEVNKAPPIPWVCSTSLTFLDRLHDYNIVIAFIFSLLWFQNSRVKAKEEYFYKATEEEDRIQLLSPKTESANEAGENKWTKLKKKKRSPRAIYYRRITSRMLLLPLGFYIIIFHLVRGLMNGKWLYHELLIDNPSNETVYLTIQDPKEYVTIEISRTHAKMSTLFAIFTYLKYHFLLATTAARAKLETRYIPQLKRRIVFSAVRHPRNFLRNLHSVLKYVRWLRFIIPLAVKLNKLRGNAMATLRKRRQFRKAKRRKKLQKALWKKKTQAEKEEDAAIVIQRVWRSFQNRRHAHVAVHFAKDKKLSSAMKIQLAFRRMSLESRMKVAKKRRELARLEHLKRSESQNLNDDERRRLYELQDEFMTEAKKTINKRLLMRPNTWMAVAWNSMFLFCILVEISRNALNPWLIIPKGQRTDDRKYKSMRLFVAESLIPPPVAETPACKDIFKKSALSRLFFRKGHVEKPSRQEVLSAFIDEIIDPDIDPLDQIYSVTNHTTEESRIPWQCSEPISTWRDNWRNIVVLALCPNPLSEWPTCRRREKTFVDTIISPFHKKKAKPFPWYCNKPYSAVHDMYRLMWNFIIDQIQIVISIICFLDVFVKFFTGEIDPVTRELRPRPFFKRWIFPGLLLQLLVNPAIGSFSTFVFQFVGMVMTIGPVRVLRWIIAVVIPIVYGLKHLIVTALQEAPSDRQIIQYGLVFWEYSYYS